MAPLSNPRILFQSIPEKYIVPGETTTYDTTQTIDLDHVPLNDGFLVRTLLLSSDPYLRGRMRDPSTESYAPAYAIGKPVDNFGIGVVLRSEDPNYQPGDYVYGVLTFEEYSVCNASTALAPFRKLDKPAAFPWSLYVGVLGMPGQTAYMGWKAYAEQKAEKAKTLFVSGGAGAVGSLVIQLAKRTNPNLKVIASAGSQDKVDFIKSIGADIAFNYKTESTDGVLSAHRPIDIYWDNVAGPTVGATLNHMTRGGLIVACGAISEYNGEEAYVKNFGEIFTRSLNLHGFLVADHMPRYMEDFYAELPPLVAQGEIKYMEHRYEGLKAAERSLVDVHYGKNVGKAVIIVSEA